MSEETTEGNQVTQGEQAAKLDSSSAGQPYESQIALLTRKLEAQEATLRALQSGKDKAVDRALREIEPLKDSFAKFAQKLNIDPDKALEAQRQLVIDEIVEERMGKHQVGSAVAGTIAAPTSNVDMAGILSKVGLSNEDGIVFMRNQYTDPNVAELEAYRMKNKTISPPQPESLSAAKGNPLPGKLSDAEFTQKTKELQILYRNPSSNKAKIKKLEGEIEEYLP
jgi:DNA-binding transcriptional MocR family regulator